MEMWFSELHTSNVKLSMRIEKQLFSGNSDCQRIDVLESVEFGKFLALDGDILFSEKDEFIYDEMVTHVPMAVHPDVRHVLIIGGGDGGVAKELTQYDSIEKIDVVEPDEMLVEVCREHFPELACGLDDPRVNVYYQDGLRFLRNKTEEYDLIINDATDPFGHTEGLFTKEFYGSCYKALKEDGIMVYQHGSPFYDEDKEECMKMHRKAFRAFPVSRVYQAHIPTCSSGYWLFGFASKKYHPLNNLRVKEWKKLHIKTRYYTTNLHRGAYVGGDFDPKPVQVARFIGRIHAHDIVEELVPCLEPGAVVIELVLGRVHINARHTVLVIHQDITDQRLFVIIPFADDIHRLGTRIKMRTLDIGFVGDTQRPLSADRLIGEFDIDPRRRHDDRLVGCRRRSLCRIRIGISGGVSGQRNDFERIFRSGF